MRAYRTFTCGAKFQYTTRLFWSCYCPTCRGLRHIPLGDDDHEKCPECSFDPVVHAGLV